MKDHSEILVFSNKNKCIIDSTIHKYYTEFLKDCIEKDLDENNQIIYFMSLINNSYDGINDPEMTEENIEQLKFILFTSIWALDHKYHCDLFKFQWA